MVDECRILSIHADINVLCVNYSKFIHHNVIFRKQSYRWTPSLLEVKNLYRSATGAPLQNLAMYYYVKTNNPKSLYYLTLISNDVGLIVIEITDFKNDLEISSILQSRRAAV